MLHGLRDPALLQRILYEALDHSDDIIVILEQTGDGADDIVNASVNEAFCHTCGRSQQELIGRTLRSFGRAGCRSGGLRQCHRGGTRAPVVPVRDALRPAGRRHVLARPAPDAGARRQSALRHHPGPRHHRKPAGRRAAGSNPGPAGEGVPVRQGAGRHRDRQRHRPDDQSRPRPSGRISTSIVWYSGLPPSRRSPKSPPAGRCSSW